MHENVMYQLNLGVEFKGFKKMLKKDLAEQLGISGAMVSRLAKRGMPTDSLERAQRWRRRHLEQGRMKGNRFDPNQMAAPPPTPASAKPAPPLESPSPDTVLLREIEMAARCFAVVLRGADEASGALLLAELRQRLRLLPPGAQPAMPVRTWIALTDWALSNESEVRQFELQDEVATPDDFAMLVNASIPVGGEFWLVEACDWEGYSLNGFPDVDDLEGTEPDEGAAP